MDSNKIRTGTERPILRNERGQIVNEVGVTYSEWGENLHKQYYESVTKIKQGSLTLDKIEQIAD
jgi:hypothetical protein